MIKVYLAARYSRREELCEYREQLRAAGFEVVGRWLNGEHQALDDDPGEMAQLFAMDDVEDITQADIIVSFTEPSRTPNANRGGRHVEFGIALGMRWWAWQLTSRDVRLIVVGHRENVFHWLPEVEFFPTWDEARAELAAVESAP